MSQSSAALTAPLQTVGPAFHWWRVAIPVLITPPWPHFRRPQAWRSMLGTTLPSSPA